MSGSAALGPRVLAAAVSVLLAGPAFAWAAQAATVLGTCANGLRNPDAVGELTGTACTVYLGSRPVVELPWQEDVLIAGWLITAQVAALTAVFARGRAAATAAVLLPPALFAAGVPMGLRAWSERAMDRMLNLATTEASLSGTEHGWTLHPGGTAEIAIPEPAGSWLLPAFFAGVASCALALWLLKAGYRMSARTATAAIIGLCAVPCLVIAPAPTPLLAFAVLAALVGYGLFGDGRLAGLALVAGGPATIGLVLRAEYIVRYSELPGGSGAVLTGMLLLSFAAAGTALVPGLFMLIRGKPIPSTGRARV